jgi:aspartyl-tRNA(Asn)/glutamyl-tRNA(Gln) amidotransferase subunit C
MDISREELERIAALSKLAFEKREYGKFRAQVSAILTFIAELKEVDVSKESAVGQINREENNWRDDVVRPCSKETIEQLLEGAPELEKRFITGPGVFDGA